MTSSIQPGEGMWGRLERWLPAAAAAWLFVAAGLPDIPLAAGVGVAELLLLVLAAGVGARVVCCGDRVAVPPLVLLFLGLYAVAAAGAGAGMAGLKESLQRVLQLLVAVVVLSWSVRRHAGWMVLAVSGAVGVKALVLFVSVVLPGQAPVDLLSDLGMSRIALGSGLVLALCWVFAFWLRGESRRWWRAAVAGGVVLALVPHGQVLVTGAFCLVLAGMVHSLRGGLAGTGAAGIAALAILCIPVLRENFGETLSLYDSGRMRQAHTETVVGFRMGAENPWHGVGAGRYQEFVGQYYRELHNPNENQIEPDHQSGWAILVGTVGMPGALTLLAALAVAGGTAVWARSTAETGRNLPAGALATCTGVALLMLFTDPFIKEAGWLVALGLGTSACLRCAPVGDGGPTVRAGVDGWLTGWRALIPVAGVLALLNAAVPFAGRSGDNPAPTLAEQNGVIEITGMGLVQGDPGNANTIPGLVMLAGAPDAHEVALPMRVISDTSGRQVLRVPDEAGKPPPDQEPSLEYGGAAFQFTADTAGQATVWLRAWWDDGCANSIFVKLNDAKALTAGNDGTYERWHWVRVPVPVALLQGENRLEVLNREDGVGIDQVLVTRDASYVPQGVEVN